MKRFLALGVLVVVLATAACDGLNRAMTSHTGIVARAAGLELTVDETAGLLAQNDRLAAEPEVVDAVANLWVDYVLLTTAAAQDSTLGSVDVGPLIDPIFEQKIFLEFNEKVINPDTTISDEELLALYERQQPGTEIRARHILLRIAPDATAADRASLLDEARDLRAQLVAGDNFAKVAEEKSEDPGSAKQGGDLGFFSRGQMVAPFDEAAFALEVGEISDVVETPFGYHIIKLEERRGPTLAEIEDTFREQAINNKAMAATQDYIAKLTDSLDLKVQDGAYAVARDLAAKPDTRLSGRAASRALVTYKGGSFTAAEYLDFIRARTTPGSRAQLTAASDEDLKGVLTAMTHNETLMAAARKEGIEVTKAERNSLTTEIRGQLLDALDATGLRPVEPQQGETQAQAVARRVNAFLGAIIRGEQDLLELGAISFALRADRAGEIFERSYPEVVRKLQNHQVAPAANQPERDDDSDE
jgi:hypothetical protein